MLDEEEWAQVMAARSASSAALRAREPDRPSEAGAIGTTTLTEAELRDAIAGLRTLEREVSDQRRALFGVIDRIDVSLAAQLR